MFQHRIHHILRNYYISKDHDQYQNYRLKARSILENDQLTWQVIQCNKQIIETN